MRLISIIPDFHPKDDAVLLARAEALKPELIYTPYPAPQACSLNGEALPTWEPWSAENPCAMQFTGSGAEPRREPMTPFMQFISDRIMDRIHAI